MSDSVQPHRRQPIRFPRPWDSPGRNTEVGCYFLLQCMKVKSESKVAQSYPTLSNPMDCSPPGSHIHGIFQARILEWVAIPFSRGSSQSRDWAWVSCIAGRVFTAEPPGKPLVKVKGKLLSRVRLFGTPWTEAYQASPFMGFARQEYWSGVPLPSPRVPVAAAAAAK